jgi:MFS family permease
VGSGSSWSERLAAKVFPTVLQERNFRVYFMGRSISDLGDKILPLALSFAVLDLTESVSALGGVLAARAISLSLLVPVAGVLGDRLQRKWVLFTSDMVRLSAQIAGGLLLVTGRATVWQLVILFALYGAGEAFFAPIGNAFVAQIVRPAAKQQANAVLSLSRSLSRIVGPPIAGLLVLGVGAGWAVLLDGVTFAVSAGALVLIRLAPADGDVEAGSFVSDLLHGWREFTSRTWVWAFVLAFAFYQMTVLAPLFVLGPAISRLYLGGASTWALVSSALGVGAVVGGLLALHIRPRRPMLLGCILFFLDIPQLFFLALHGPVILLIPSAFLAGVSLTLFDTLWVTSLQEHIPSRAQSRVMAYDWLGSLAALPIGYALVGPVSEGLGMSATLLISAGGIALSAFLLLLVPSVRRLPRFASRVETEMVQPMATAGENP